MEYNIKSLWDQNGSIEVTTEGGGTFHITLDLLKQLIPPAYHDKDKKQPCRPPNNAELMVFAYTIVEDKVNPFKKECWCYWLKGCYQTIVSSHARLRKVQKQKDYEGWEWGYIGKDGKRHEPKGQVPLTEIVGGWAEVCRKGRKPWLHELFFVDCPTQGNWTSMKYTMFSKALRDQSHRLAYQDILSNLSTENEAGFISDYETTPDDIPNEPTEPEMGSEVVDIPEEQGPDPTTTSTGDGPQQTGKTIHGLDQTERASWL